MYVILPYAHVLEEPLPCDSELGPCVLLWPRDSNQPDTVCISTLSSFLFSVYSVAGLACWRVTELSRPHQPSQRLR